jgi:hypothetical protein
VKTITPASSGEPDIAAVTGLPFLDCPVAVVGGAGK